MSELKHITPWYERADRGDNADRPNNIERCMREEINELRTDRERLHAACEALRAECERMRTDAVHHWWLYGQHV